MTVDDLHTHRLTLDWIELHADSRHGTDTQAAPDVV